MTDMDATSEVKIESKSEDAEMGDAGANGNASGDAEGPKGNPGNEDKKIFVGGISYETTNEDLVSFFGKFGEVSNAQVKFDQLTGRSRGFAFVEFARAETVSEILKQKNREIKGKTVEVKPAKSRENKKIFVGGLPSEFPEDELKQHFEEYGKVDDVEWPFDRVRGIRRNFAFVVFEDEAAADAAAAVAKQKFGERLCDVKKAVPQPKRAMMGMGMGPMGGPGGMRGGRGGMRGGGRGGGYGGWGGGWGGGGYGGGWGGGGDWYGNSGGYGGGYGSHGDFSGDSYSGDNYNYWGGWGGSNQGGSSFDSYGGQGQQGAPSGRGGRFAPY